MRGDDRDAKIVTSSADTGFISQNVYLYCASQGLATVVRGWVDREECAKALNLGTDQYVTYAQTVGYPN
jgi:nitroreductase